MDEISIQDCKQSDSNASKQLLNLNKQDYRHLVC